MIAYIYGQPNAKTAHGNNIQISTMKRKQNQADPTMGAEENTCPAI
jgi:hypothetical protein